MAISPFLAPDRDEARQQARFVVSGGANELYLPGVVPTGSTAVAVSANFDHYQPIYLTASAVCDRLYAEVTTLHAANNFRMGIYRAGTTWQPVGGPLVDSGDISTATTGVKTYTPGTLLALQRGRYLLIHQTSTSTAQFRIVTGYCVTGAGIQDTIGSTPIAHLLTASRAYAAFPTPGAVWTSDGGSSGTQRYSVFPRFTAV